MFDIHRKISAAKDTTCLSLDCRAIELFFSILRTVFVLCTILIVSGSGCAFAKSSAVKLGSSRNAIWIQNRKRTYIVHIPGNYNAEMKVPLLVVLHGGLGTARTGAWDSRMSSQADKDGFVAVYPSGYLRTWNAGECCGLARRKDIDDVAFIRTLIEKLKSELSIDPDRVYVTGISNGGMMAYRLGRELSDQIAAIAPIEACMYSTPVKGNDAVSVVAFHGTGDHVVPYDGGTGHMMGYHLRATAVAENIRYWRDWDNCNKESTRSEIQGVQKEVFAGGRNGTEVCLYTLPKAGHAWPGGKRAVFIGSSPSRKLSATEAMCEFFWAHPKRRD